MCGALYDLCSPPPPQHTLTHSQVLSVHLHPTHLVGHKCNHSAAVVNAPRCPQCPQASSEGPAAVGRTAVDKQCGRDLHSHSAGLTCNRQ